MKVLQNLKGVTKIIAKSQKYRKEYCKISNYCIKEFKLFLSCAILY